MDQLECAGGTSATRGLVRNTIPGPAGEGRLSLARLLRNRAETGRPQTVRAAPKPSRRSENPSADWAPSVRDGPEARPSPVSGPLRGTLRAAGAASAELESIPNPNLKRLGSRSVDIGRQERISRSEDDAGRKVH